MIADVEMVLGKETLQSLKKLWFLDIYVFLSFFYAAVHLLSLQQGKNSFRFNSDKLWARMVRLHIHTVSQGDKTVLFFFVCTLNQTDWIVPAERNQEKS